MSLNSDVVLYFLIPLRQWNLSTTAGSRQVFRKFRAGLVFWNKLKFWSFRWTKTHFQPYEGKIFDTNTFDKLLAEPRAYWVQNLGVSRFWTQYARNVGDQVLMHRITHLYAQLCVYEKPLSYLCRSLPETEATFAHVLPTPETLQRQRAGFHTFYPARIF